MPTATVTVMFTDLVGSTALMSRVGEVAADDLRREHFELLRGHVAALGGVEVKNLGDGLMVVFTSAADAVAASVGMQQSLWRRNREAEEALEIRVGVAAGDAEVDDGDYFGAPVVQAARLCSAAGSGEILCTDLVKMLAGSRTVAGFEAVGALELKGLDDPVPAARVLWSPPEEPVAVGAVLPGRLEMAVADDFVGREAEYERLIAAWKAAVAGDRRVVLLAGEPGIGKTTLSARLACDVDDADGVVTYGRCDEDLGIPYQPWIEALTHLVTGLPQVVLDAHVADRGGHLGRLVPELTRRTAALVPNGAEGDGERFVLFGCVVDLLERASADRPVLVVLDDLHWADRQSVQLLRHVVGCGRPLRVMLLGTFRDSDVVSGDPVSDLLAGLHREQGTERISLRGLTDVDVLGLLEQLAGHDMDDRGVALRDAVLAETAGNPFFVREILRHLAETGVIYQDDDGRWVGDVNIGDVGLPVSVTEVVGRRLATLGEDSVRVLSMAAVIGRDFDVALLAAASGMDEDTVIDTCDAATAAAVLTPAGDLDRYSFAHALIERTLYEGLSRSRRARAHRAVAEALEQLAGDDPGSRAGELAHHWSEAVQPDDNERAVRYAHLAADRALTQLAPDDAVRWYRQALELLGASPPDRQRAELLVGLGEAQRHIGDPTHRDTLADAADLAEQLGATDLLAAAALASCRNFQSNTGAIDINLVTLLQRALGGLDEIDTPVRARLLVALAVEQCFGDDLDLVHDVAVQAVDVARRCADPATLAFVLQRGCVADRDPARLPARRQWLDEAVEVSAALVDPVLEFDVTDRGLILGLECGDLEAVRRFDGRSKAAALRAPQATTLWMVSFRQVWEALLRGDLGVAEGEAEAALNLGLESGQPDAMTLYGAQLACVRYHGGRIHELLDLMEDAVRTYPTLGYHAPVTLSYALMGRLDVARRQLDDAAASGFAARHDQTLTTTLVAWADAASRILHPSMATLRQLLVPFRDRLVSAEVTIFPAVAYYLGRLDHALGNHEDAERWFLEADGIHRRMESPLLIAYSDAGMAGLLVDRGRPGDAEQARLLAARALGAATAGGYGYIEADVRAVLERLGP